MGNQDRLIIEKIMRPVGKSVSFQYPGDEGHKKGILRDRAVMVSNPTENGVPYWDVVDLIEFPEEDEQNWIRIGYYRKPKENLVWGSQTTITEPISIWKRLLVKAAREKPWFRALLEQAVDELDRGKVRSAKGKRKSA